MDPADAYLVLQTLVGAWPLTRERLDLYLEKALREGKLRSNWLSPDEEYERRVQEYAWSLREVVEPFVGAGGAGRRADRARADGFEADLSGRPGHLPGRRARVALARRPGQPPAGGLERATPVQLAEPPPKLRAIREALALRARRPEAFAGTYEPVDAGADVCAFTRGGEVLVAVPLRPGARFDPPAGWTPVLDGLLYERS